MADLAIYRERFAIQAREAVEIRAIPAEEGGVRAAFYCLPCEIGLLWVPERRLLECPSCGYELTALEAQRLCEWHIDEVEQLATLVGKKRGFLWRLSRLFVGRKRA